MTIRFQTPILIPMATKTFSADDKKAYAEMKRAEQMELLEKAVDALTSQKGWLNYLMMASRFHNYSFNNRILIALQNPEATQVAGAGARNGKTGWKKLDRRVKEEEFKTKSIKILAPVMVPEKDKNGKEIIVNNKKQLKCIGFKTVEVYDVTQTEGEDLPTAPVCAPVEGNTHEEYLYRAQAFAEGQGYTIDFDSLYGSESRGYVNMDDRTIHINPSYPVNSQVRTLIHELAHIVGGVDYSRYTRAQAEIIVESAAFVATALVGLDTAGISVPYITTWGADADDPKAALQTMREFTKNIDEIADVLVEGIS